MSEGLICYLFNNKCGRCTGGLIQVMPVLVDNDML